MHMIRLTVDEVTDLAKYFEQGLRLAKGPPPESTLVEASNKLRRRIAQAKTTGVLTIGMDESSDLLELIGQGFSKISERTATKNRKPQAATYQRLCELLKDVRSSLMAQPTV